MKTTTKRKHPQFWIIKLFLITTTVAQKFISYKYKDEISYSITEIFEKKISIENPIIYSEYKDIFITLKENFSEILTHFCNNTSTKNIFLGTPLDSGKSSFTCLDTSEKKMTSFFFGENSKIEIYQKKIFSFHLNVVNFEEILQSENGQNLLLKFSEKKIENLDKIIIDVASVKQDYSDFEWQTQINVPKNDTSSKFFLDKFRKKKLISYKKSNILEKNFFLIFFDLNFSELSKKSLGQKMNSLILYGVTSIEKKLKKFDVLETANQALISENLVSIEDVIFFKKKILFLANLQKDTSTIIYECEGKITEKDDLKIELCKVLVKFSEEKVSKVRFVLLKNDDLYLSFLYYDLRKISIFQYDENNKKLISEVNTGIITKISKSDLEVEIPFFSENQFFFIFKFSNQEIPFYGIRGFYDEKLKKFLLKNYQLNTKNFIGFLDNSVITVEKISKNLKIFNENSEKILKIENNFGDIPLFDSKIYFRSSDLGTTEKSEDTFFMLRAVRNSLDSIKISKKVENSKWYKGSKFKLPFNFQNFEGSNIEIELQTQDENFEFSVEKSQNLVFSFDNSADVDDYFPVKNGAIGVTNNLRFMFYQCIKQIKEEKVEGFGKKVKEFSFEFQCKLQKNFDLKGFIVFQVEEWDKFYVLVARNSENILKIIHLGKENYEIFSKDVDEKNFEIFESVEFRENIFHFLQVGDKIKIYESKNGKFENYSPLNFEENCIKNFTIYCEEKLNFEIFKNCEKIENPIFELLEISDQKIKKIKDILKFEKSELDHEAVALIKKEVKILYKENSKILKGFSLKYPSRKFDLDIDFFNEKSIIKIQNHKNTNFFSMMLSSKKSKDTSIITYNTTDFGNPDTRIFDIFSLQSIFPNFLTSFVKEKNIILVKMRELSNKYFRVLNTEGPIGFLKTKIDYKENSKFVNFNVKNEKNSTSFSSQVEFIESKSDVIDGVLNENLKIEEKKFSEEKIFKSLFGHIVDFKIEQKSGKFEILKNRFIEKKINLDVFASDIDDCSSKYRYFGEKFFIVFLCNKNNEIFFNVLFDDLTSIKIKDSLKGEFEIFDFSVSGENFFLTIVIKVKEGYKLQFLILSQKSEKKIFTENEDFTLKHTKLDQIFTEILEETPEKNSQILITLSTKPPSSTTTAYTVILSNSNSKFQISEKMKKDNFLDLNLIKFDNKFIIVNRIENKKSEIEINGFSKSGILDNFLKEKKFTFPITENENIIFLDCISNDINPKEFICLAVLSSPRVLLYYLKFNDGTKEFTKEKEFEFFNFIDDKMKFFKIFQNEKFFVILMTEGNFGYSYYTMLYKKFDGKGTVMPNLYFGIKFTSKNLVNFDKINYGFLKENLKNSVKDGILFRSVVDLKLKNFEISNFELGTSVTKISELNDDDVLQAWNFKFTKNFKLKTLFNDQIKNPKADEKPKETEKKFFEKVKIFYDDVVKKLGVLLTIVIIGLITLLLVLCCCVCYNRIRRARLRKREKNNKELVLEEGNLVYNLEDFQLDLQYS